MKQIWDQRIETLAVSSLFWSTFSTYSISKNICSRPNWLIDLKRTLLNDNLHRKTKSWWAVESYPNLGPYSSCQVFLKTGIEWPQGCWTLWFLFLINICCHKTFGDKEIHIVNCAHCSSQRSAWRWRQLKSWEKTEMCSKKLACVCDNWKNNCKLLKNH